MAPESPHHPINGDAQEQSATPPIVWPDSQGSADGKPGTDCCPLPAKESPDDSEPHTSTEEARREAFAVALRQLSPGRLNTTLLVASQAGWQYIELAHILEVSYQRVGQRLSEARYTPSASSIPVPPPLERPLVQAEQKRRIAAAVVASYHEDVPVAEIAKRLGIGWRRVGIILRAAGVELPRQYDPALSAQAEELVARYQAGETVTEIAKSVYFSIRTVHQLLKANGVQFRPAGRRRRS